MGSEKEQECLGRSVVVGGLRVVEPTHARDFARELDAMLDAGEAVETRLNRRRPATERARRNDRRKLILPIVLAAQDTARERVAFAERFAVVRVDEPRNRPRRLPVENVSLYARAFSTVATRASSALKTATPLAFCAANKHALAAFCVFFDRGIAIQMIGRQIQVARRRLRRACAKPSAWKLDTSRDNDIGRRRIETTEAPSRRAARRCCRRRKSPCRSPATMWRDQRRRCRFAVGAGDCAQLHFRHDQIAELELADDRRSSRQCEHRRRNTRRDDDELGLADFAACALRAPVRR